MLTMNMEGVRFGHLFYPSTKHTSNHSLEHFQLLKGTIHNGNLSFCSLLIKDFLVTQNPKMMVKFLLFLVLCNFIYFSMMLELSGSSLLDHLKKCVKEKSARKIYLTFDSHTNFDSFFGASKHQRSRKVAFYPPNCSLSKPSVRTKIFFTKKKKK